jgi:tripartite-type tricarboxylate transporter receptor subunit TctC
MKASVLRALLGSLIALASSAAAEYPERPLRLILSSAPGASSDIVSRILAAELVKQMGQQIIIDNRPGAVQTIGTAMIVRANPDGYTLGYANVVTLAINKALLAKLPYDPDRDLALVGQFLSTYNLLAVANSLPVKSVKELIDYARLNPGRLLNCSSGNGTTGH